MFETDGRKEKTSKYGFLNWGYQFEAQYDVLKAIHQSILVEYES